MAKKLDISHTLILNFLEKNNWWKNIGLRQIAKYAKLSHPQKALNKLNQLEKMWYIRKNHENGGYDIFKDNPIPEFVTIPIYSSDQCGSEWFQVPTTLPIRQVKIPSDILWITNNEEYFFVKAKWKSLLPLIKPNDLVLVKKERILEEWKKYVVIHNSKPKIKILQKIWKESWLISTNFNFDKEQPFVVKKNIKILWTTKKVITSV